MKFDTCTHLLKLSETQERKVSSILIREVWPHYVNNKIKRLSVTASVTALANAK